MAGDYALIAGGKRLPVDCEVRTWLETGLHYDGLKPREETWHGVVHYTNGPNPPEVMFDNLKRRKSRKTGKPMKLSVQLALSAGGVLYQFCDLDMRCQHAGTVDDSNRDGIELSANAHSWGIEVVNPAKSYGNARRVPAQVEIEEGFPRQVLRETIHGVELVRTTFTAAQTITLLKVVPVICAHYGLPVAVPMENGDVVARVLTEEEFTAHRGMLAHYMLTTGKFDCGIAPMRAINALQFRGKERPAE